jgi:hypothetical protein
MAAHAEELVRRCEALEGDLRRLRTELETLQAQVLMIELTLNTQLLAPERWDEDESQQALKRALHLLCHKMVLSSSNEAGTLWRFVSTKPRICFFVKPSRTRARALFLSRKRPSLVGMCRGRRRSAA